MSHTTHFTADGIEVNAIHDGDWSGPAEIAWTTRGVRQVVTVPGPVILHLAAILFARASAGFGEDHAQDGAVHFGEQHAADWLVGMVLGGHADRARLAAPDPLAGCLALGALRKLLAVTDEKDARGEPTIGHDQTGAVNWLLDFADDVVRPILQPRKQGGQP